MFDGRKVLVIGGTRGTGLLIVRSLERLGATIRVMARDPVSARAALGPAVEVWPGDVTKADTLPAAAAGVRDIIFTAGCRSGRPATEARIRATEYEGVVHTLAAARATRFCGRFMYMTASGVMRRSLISVALNVYKGNTLRWRRLAEGAIRESSVDYTIIRTGMLVNRPGGQRPVRVTQDALPLSLRYRISRADVATVFVGALVEPRASRATFEIAWAPCRNATDPVETSLTRLKSDDVRSLAR